jgi:hypothetical protein
MAQIRWGKAIKTNTQVIWKEKRYKNEGTVLITLAEETKNLIRDFDDEFL